MTVTTGRADLANHGQYDVFGSHAKGQLALDAHLHVLHFFSDQALRSEHMLDFRSADAMGQCSESAMRRGVRVPADHCHPRQGCALLWADHMNDALTNVVHLEFKNAKVVAVLVQSLHLDTGNLIGDRFQAALTLALGSRHIVIRGGNVGIDAPWLAPGQAKPFKRLR